MAKRTPLKHDADEHLQRLRRLCGSFPEVSERLSHGEPTFFIRKRVLAMFDNNHHNDGHLAVWLPMPPGFQEMLVSTWPEKYFRPPYVGVSGWVGVELPLVDDDELADHLAESYKLTAPKALPSGGRKAAPRRKAK